MTISKRTSRASMMRAIVFDTHCQSSCGSPHRKQQRYNNVRSRGCSFTVLPQFKLRLSESEPLRYLLGKNRTPMTFTYQPTPSNRTWQPINPASSEELEQLAQAERKLEECRTTYMELRQTLQREMEAHMLTVTSDGMSVTGHFPLQEEISRRYEELTKQHILALEDALGGGDNTKAKIFNMMDHLFVEVRQTQQDHLCNADAKMCSSDDIVSRLLPVSFTIV